MHKENIITYYAQNKVPRTCLGYEPSRNKLSTNFKLIGNYVKLDQSTEF